MTDSKLYPSEQYYGTGECFLFTFYPSFKVSSSTFFETFLLKHLSSINFELFTFLKKYPWTGENNFFMRGNHDKIGFGCGE